LDGGEQKMKIINFICSGIVVIMVLVTAFMIWRLEVIRKTSRAKTRYAKLFALISGGIWLLVYFLFNPGWQTGQFFDRLGFLMALLLILPYVSYLRLWLCLRLDKIGRTIAPRITQLEKVSLDEGVGFWQAKYEYLGEYRGKRRVRPTQQVLSAQYAQENESADEDEGAVAVGLPNATIRYLSNRPNVHRFEYQEPLEKPSRRKISIPIHQKGFFRLNWKMILFGLGFVFSAVVVFIGLDTWNDRNDLVVPADHGWTETELILEQGQCVRLEPSGKVRISDVEGYDGEIGVAGWEALCTPNEAGDCMKNNAPYGALIARFGEGKPFVLNQKRNVSVTDSGPLWLAINDNQERFDDNSGYFRVKFEVLNKPCD
jgi:hypothetical protein